MRWPGGALIGVGWPGQVVLVSPFLFAVSRLPVGLADGMMPSNLDCRPLIVDCVSSRPPHNEAGTVNSRGLKNTLDCFA